MKHQNSKTVSIQFPGKSHNEDCAYDWATKKGHIFLVIDFANFSYTTLSLTLQRTLEQAVLELDQLPGLSVDSFLGHVGKELNNFVYTFGRDNCDGKLFCVAAIALLHGNQLYCLTYGDSRINIFTDDRLLLLNGAKYQTRSVISDTKDVPPQVRENPEQMGRSLFEMPLTDRVRSFELSDQDIVLMFSDGLEENVTPQRRLSELRTLGKSDPKSICDAMLKISDALDDRTITVIGGPYTPLADSLIEQVEQVFGKFDQRLAGVESISQRQSEIIGTLSNHYLPRSEVSNLTKQFSSEGISNKVASLEQKIEKLETKNGKGKGRGTDGPVVFTLDQAAYDAIREIVNAKSVNDSNQTESANSSDPNPMVLKRSEHNNSESETGLSRVLSNPKVVMLSIFFFGMVALWLLQVFSKKVWPERWVAQTEGELLTVRRDDYLGTGPIFSVKLQPPVPIIRHEASSFEELAPLVARLQQQGARPEPTASPNRPDTSAVPTDTVESVQVQQNDTLNRIAERYKTTEAKLRELNPTITDWGKIKRGQQIQVPSANVNGNSQK